MLNKSNPLLACAGNPFILSIGLPTVGAPKRVLAVKQLFGKDLSCFF